MSTARSNEPIVDRAYGPIITFTRFGFMSLRLKLMITGSEHIPATGGAVLAANHTGYMDFTFIGAAARERGRLVRFLCKKEIFDHPLGGPVMRSMHHVSVDREAGTASFSQSLRLLKAGELIGIFPEGTVSRSFEPIEFQSGATALAAASNVPLLPIAIWGSQRVWTKARKPAFPRHRTPIMVAVGEPMFFERRENHDAATERVRERIAEMLTALQVAYADQPRNNNDRWWVPARLGGTAPTPEEAAELEIQRRAEKQARKQATD